ncbi:sulfate transporter CysZ [Marinomonas agarivorans]|nr:sulfate transporter CysZ [Marinomonas agarivorans]
MIFQPFKAVQAFLQAIPFLLKPELRAFLLFPILVNIVLMLVFYAVAWFYFTPMVNYFMSWVPDWLFFLNWLFYMGFAFLCGVIFFYGFSVGVNIIAAPFNGLLAEKVEELWTKEQGIGKHVEESFTLKDLSRLIVDSVIRELQKLAYFLPRLVLLLLISWIPIINVVSPFLWLLFGGWMMAIQYLDYPFDNNKVSFADMRLGLGKKPLLCWTFGAIVMVLLPIPLLNLVIMPLAVVTATILWLSDLQKYYSVVDE